MMMSSLAAAVCVVSFALTVLPGPAIADPAQPCETGKLSFAIESEDVPEDCGATLVLKSVQSMPIYLRYDNSDPVSILLCVTVISPWPLFLFDFNYFNAVLKEISLI